MRLKRTIVLILIFFITSIFIIAKFNEKEQGKVIYTIKDDFSSTCIIVDELMDKLKIPRLKSEAITEDEFSKRIFSENNIFELKQRYMAVNEDRKCLPMAKATIVFAVDRTKVKEKIDTWQDLIDSDYKVLISHKNKDLGVSTLIAMNIGLGYGEENLNRSNSIIEKMAKNNRIEYLNEHIDKDMNLINISKASISPIMVLWDYQAAYIKENINRDIDIIVPKDGTFTTNMGIVSNIKEGKECEEFNKISEYFQTEDGQKLIIKNNFRTIDKKANRDIYPSEIEYKNAKEIDDYGELNKNLFDFYQSRGNFGIRERVIMTGFLVVIWSLYTYLRFPKSNIRKYFITVCVLLIFWGSMKFIRVHVESYHTRVFWYLYYVPMNMIPTIFYYLFYEYRYRKKVPKKIVCLTLSISIFFIIMAVTNEFHNYFFHLHIESNSLKSKYNYGIFYYLDMLWAFILVVASLRNIFATFKYKSKRNIKMVLIAYCGMIITYNILYSNEITKLDLTTTMTLLILIAMELIIRFILVENRYMKYPLFNRVNTVIGVLDENFNTIYLNHLGKR
ncbi:MAG: ABC transporter substrate-binding protein [Andreesenia angusta]|nr:ABC transporter substrate-binding protein [Andreesenia angusta]